MSSSITGELAFSIIPIEGKGKGAIAKRQLRMGELVLSDPPLFVQTLSRDSKTIKAALTRLPVAQQREYFALANCHRKTMDPIRGVFETNCLPLGDNDILAGELASQAGIFPIASRFNSSCVPNVNHRYDEKSGQERLYAMRDIAEGEELCVSYAPLFEPRVTRRWILQQKFKFTCGCSACCLDGDALRQSDARRKEANELYQEIGSGGNPREVLLKVKRALTILDQEGLYPYRESFYYDGFQCCVMVSDFPNAKSWIKRAHDVGVVCSGPDYEKLEKFKALMKRPQEHPAAGCYPRGKLSGPPS